MATSNNMPKSPSENLKTLIEDNKKLQGQYKRDEEDQAAFDYFTIRKRELLSARKNVGGTNIEDIWKAADKAYVPHDMKQRKGTSAFVSDDELGWRSTPVIIGREDDWMEESASVKPYIKVQTALGILIDRNPEAVFKALAKRYEPANVLHKELHRRNWDVAQSKQMLKTLVFNGSKYGVMYLQTAPLRLEYDVRDLVRFDPKDKSKNQYVDSKVVRYDDVYRWALDPWTTWVDDGARPGDQFSLNDWMRRKDYSWEHFVLQFRNFPNFKYVIPKSVDAGKADDEDTGAGVEGKPETKKEVVRVWFYENLARDMYYMQTDDGVVLLNIPIPKKPKNKRLSISAAPWTLRNWNTIIGISTYEAIRNDYKIYNKIRNMTVDQLVLSIYKEWFYEGTNTLQNTGEMKIKPGIGRQVSNAKNMKWNEVPGPGREAWQGLEFFSSEIDDASGVTKTLEGELSPKAKAFDIAQAREASLKRLKTPLDNIAYVLEQDAYISVGLYEELYSIPEIEMMTDPEKIAAYKENVQNEVIDGVTPDMLEESEQPLLNEEGEDTGEVSTTLAIKRFREFPINVERDNDGNLLQTKEEQFFQIKPEDLPWEGKISVTGQSIIAESPLLEKQEKLELANLLLPLFDQPPQVVLPAAKQLLKIYDEDPEDWFPQHWLVFMQTGVDPTVAPPEDMGAGMPGEEPLFVDAGGGAPPPIGGNRPPGAEGARKVVPSAEVNPGEGSPVGKFLSRLNPFSNP